MDKVASLVSGDEYRLLQGHGSGNVTNEVSETKDWPPDNLEAAPKILLQVEGDLNHLKTFQS
jgi:hypothetical protein